MACFEKNVEVSGEGQEKARMTKKDVEDENGEGEQECWFGRFENHFQQPGKNLAPCHPAKAATIGPFGAFLGQFLLMYIFANFTAVYCLIGILNTTDSNTTEAVCNNDYKHS